MAFSMSLPWIPTETRMSICWGRSATLPLMRRRYERFRQIKEIDNYLHGLKTEVVVVEVSIVDDRRVKFLGISHDGVICLFGDHRTWLIVFGIDVGEEIVDYLGELLLGLLMQVRHRNPEVSAEKREATEQQGWRSRDVWWSCKLQSRQQDYRVQPL